MTQWQQSGEMNVPVGGHDDVPEHSEADSAFDIAQNLLNAVLDEVRTPGSTPASPPDAQSPVPKDGSATRRRRRRSSQTGPVAQDDEEMRRITAPISALAGALALPEQDIRSRQPATSEPASEVATNPATEPAARAAAAKGRPRAVVAASRPRRRTTFALVALVAVAVAGVAGLVAEFGGGTSDGPAILPAVRKHAQFAFDPITTPDGMKVERVWELNGRTGSRFVGKLSFSNPTSAPLNASHTEVIPKSLASSVQDIVFDLEPVVIEADPVVEYSMMVPAGAEITARYEIQVAPEGVQRARLEDWAADLEEASTGSTTSTTTAPTTSTSRQLSLPPRRPTKAPAKTPTKSPVTSPTTHPTTPTTASPPTPTTTSPPTPTTTAPPAKGTIIIRVISSGGTGTFGFSGPSGNVSVTTSGSPDGSGQSASMTVAAGKYTWTQVSRPPGWGAPKIDCTDRDAGPFEDRSTVSGAAATFNVQAGETVVCTWTNKHA